MSTEFTRKPTQVRDVISRIPIANIAIYGLIFFGGILMVLPLYFMLIFATQSRETIFSFPPPLLPGSIDQIISNYNALIKMTEGTFWRVFWNSGYLASVATITTIFFSSLAGYGFALYEFKGRNVLFNVIIATQAIPNSLNLIPFYLVMNLIGWINQPRALWFPGMASAFGIFMTRQYIQSAIPSELMDAARVDGCTEFGIFWRIVLPLIRPVLGTLGLITFIGVWNEFVLQSLIFRTPETRTLQTLIRAISGGTTATNVDYGGFMMGTAITVLPLLILFIFTSKQLISGLTAGSVKT
jgi:multiple sugar transport system permease protein